MRSLTYISDNGCVVSMVNRAPYIFNRLISDLGATPQIGRSPGRDGATTYNVNLNQRNINVKGFIHALGNHRLDIKTIVDEHKNFLDTCFNPNTFGTLIYQNNRGGQIIRARPITTPTYSEIRNFQNIAFDIEFVSDDCYWESIKLFEERLGTTTKLWKFPFTLPLKFGEYSSEVTINNPTKMNIKPIIEVYSNAEMITVSNLTTEKSFTVEHEILSHQTMVIDSKTATVSLHENNTFVSDVSNWVTVTSDFIELVPGKNTLKITNEMQYDSPNAKIFYRIPILGV